MKPDATYRIAGVYSFGRGLIDRGTISGSETSYKQFDRRSTETTSSSANLTAGRVRSRWSMATFSGACVSPEFPVLSVNENQLMPDLLALHARRPAFWAQLEGYARGSMVRRRRITADDVLRVEIPLPSLLQQREVVARARDSSRGGRARRTPRERRSGRCCRPCSAASSTED